MWRLQHGQSLRHHLWGEECVVYNSLTGHTHLLDLNALDLLLALQDGPQDIAGLCRALASPGDAPGELEAAIAAVLEELRLSSLVEPC
jgi:PqqD family protein of HPr-rel-A system